VYHDSVAVERKTLEDFVSTGIRSRKRFTRELRRLCGYDAACVVVQADLRDILGGRYRSEAHPNAVLGALLSIVVNFGPRCSSAPTGRPPVGSCRDFYTGITGRGKRKRERRR
jgi:ERCC4-type nuclease